MQLPAIELKLTAICNRAMGRARDIGQEYIYLNFCGHAFLPQNCHFQQYGDSQIACVFDDDFKNHG